MMVIMGWSNEHKKETKERILIAAAGALREGGLAKASVADIMERAGLTHGGFYSHFKSKDALVSEAFAYAANQVVGKGNDEYLNKRHMQHPEYGCPFPTLGAEMTRTTKLRRAFGEMIRDRLERMKQRFTGQDRDVKAAGTLACRVGAILLARGLPEDEGAKFLEQCLAFLNDQL